MCRARRASMLGDVNGETITITLELRVAADSLTGHCVGPDGAVRRFAGWLGLVAAIDALLAEREPRDRLDTEDTDPREETPK